MCLCSCFICCHLLFSMTMALFALSADCVYNVAAFDCCLSVCCSWMVLLVTHFIMFTPVHFIRFTLALLHSDCQAHVISEFIQCLFFHQFLTLLYISYLSPAVCLSPCTSLLFSRLFSLYHSHCICCFALLYSSLSGCFIVSCSFCFAFCVLFYGLMHLFCFFCVLHLCPVHWSCMSLPVYPLFFILFAVLYSSLFLAV